MVNTLRSHPPSPTANPAQKTNKKHQRLIEKTWQTNSNSNYTEKIRDLGQTFRYEDCCDRDWNIPEISLLYGTSFYETASEQQKRILNHLYWMTLYQGVTATELGAIVYNQITAGVFEEIGSHDTLCHELDLETAQEKQHIRTFQKICSKTKLALLGKTPIGNSQQKKSANQLRGSMAIDWQYYGFRLLAKLLLKNYTGYYSPYLKAFEQKGQSIPVPTHGVVGQMAPLLQLKFLTINFGMSPFLACQTYAIRYASNIILKAQEICYSRYFLETERQGKPVPAPTAVSRYHFLDESFHTTTSQALAIGLHQDFPRPSAYEKFVANRMFYNIQKNLLGGLSGVLPGRCVTDDCDFMLFFYRILQSQSFGLSAREALHWLEKCFCQEHEGFHVTLKYHQKLLIELRRVFSALDYLWPVNREFQLMAAGASIPQAIQTNLQTFKRFSRAVALDSTTKMD